MKIIIISPFYPLRGGIANETQVIYEKLKVEHDVKIINFKRLYPNILFPGKSQYVSNYKKSPNEDKTVFNKIDSINPFTWIKTSNFILKNNVNTVIFRYWHPFFIPAYYTIAKNLKNKNKKIKIYAICDNIYSHEKFFFIKYLSRNFFKIFDQLFTMSDNTTNQLKEYIDSSKIKTLPLLSKRIHIRFHSIFDTMRFEKQREEGINWINDKISNNPCIILSLVSLEEKRP